MENVSGETGKRILNSLLSSQLKSDEFTISESVEELSRIFKKMYQKAAHTAILIVLLFLGSGSQPVEKRSAEGFRINSPDYLQIVLAYADTLITKGRDNYGSRHSPLFTAALDRETHLLLEGEKLEKVKNLDRETWGIRNSDRSLTGANPMHHLNLYQTLYALSEVTDDDKYVTEADNALSWFFSNCQSEVTGLLAWGEHMGWDFREEQPIVGEEYHSEGTHEFFRPWVLWDRSFSLVPKACNRFARGLWHHQIGNKETGNFSRHALYPRHSPGLNSHYPRHGGFIINTWAHAFSEAEQDSALFREAMNTLVTFFKNQRSPYSRGLPAETAMRSEGMLMWPQSNLSLAIDLYIAAEMVPADLAKRMKQQAAVTDTVFLNLDHELGPEGRGFVKAANTNTLVPADVRGQHHRVYTRMWATGYGESINAEVANICMLRYRQGRDGQYKNLVVQAADRYLESEPDIDYPIYPGTLGNVIWALLNAHELTGENKYMARADYFAKKSIDMFIDETSPLPKASTHHEHYEAITRGDTLMMALLRLWSVQNGISGELDLVFTDR